VRGIDGGAGWRKGNADREHGHRVSDDEDRAIEDHRAWAELNGMVARPERHQRRLAMVNLVVVDGGEEEAHVGDVAIGLGLKWVEDEEVEVGLLLSGSDGDDEWWLAVLNDKPSGGK
jgi:hypothetical protein